MSLLKQRANSTIQPGHMVLPYDMAVPYRIVYKTYRSALLLYLDCRLKPRSPITSTVHDLYNIGPLKCTLCSNCVIAMSTLNLTEYIVMKWYLKVVIKGYLYLKLYIPLSMLTVASFRHFKF